MMERINQISKAQENVGQEIKRIYNNMKKDSSSRKTEDYFQERSSTIQSLWEEARKNNEELNKLKNEETEQASYFKNKYFNQITAVYNEAVQYINKFNEGETSAKPSISNNESVEEMQIRSRQIREQEIRIEEFINSINKATVELEKGKPIENYQWWIKDIEKQWEIISQLNISIKIMETEFNHPYFIEQKFEKARKGYGEISEALSATTMNKSTSSSRVKLPEIQIPVFHGKYEEWTTFQDIFKKVIHNNAGLTKTEKMQYLKTYVKGEASKSINHFQINEINYDSAWEELANMYDNKRLTLKKLVEKIMEFPIINSECSKKLRELYNTTKECMEAIRVMGIDVSSWDPIIMYNIYKKWDARTNELYEASIKEPLEIQNLQEMLTFIRTRFQALEAGGEKRSEEKKRNLPQVAAHIKEGKRSSYCYYCNFTNHAIHQCNKFVALSVTDRLRFIKELRLCHVCMRHDSFITCRARFGCSICNRNHNTLLHQEYNERRATWMTKKNEIKTNEKLTEKVNKSKEVTSHVIQHNTTVLLATAMIKVKNWENGTEYLRALIDSGSQGSFITEEAAAVLNLPREKIRAEINGIGAEKTSIKSNSKIRVVCKPRYSSNYTLTTELMILPKLTKSLPEKSIEAKLEQWDNCILADPTFYTAGPIDILLGATDYKEIILQGIKKTDDGLLGQNTEFGWIIQGNSPTQPEKNINIISMITRAEEIELSKYWEMEDINEPVRLNNEEEFCEEFYANTVKRQHNGAYEVRIPFKENKQLGESRSRATARLIQVEKRLDKDKNLTEGYKSFMNEYLNLGHMVLVPKSEEQKGLYYLPHHVVIKEDSTTSKQRVVYDASCKTTNGKSLNDIMYVGPRLQQELADILMRWRTHKIGFTADIEKMFRQIKIHEDDQDYQRILYRFNHKDPIQEFKLTTVTYGMAVSPYLAVKTMQKLAKDEELRFPEASRITMNDFYVDDLISGADSEEEAINLQEQLIEMFKSGGCNLRKWFCNSKNFMNNLSSELQDDAIKEIKEGEFKKSLGINWSPQDDSIKFKVHVKNDPPRTKRTILKEVAKLFDPLGWLAPVTIRAKIFIQTLWIKKLGWDEPIPNEIQESWSKYYMQLADIETITIKRWTGQTKDSEIEIHGFCDAAEKAYGAVVYLKVVSNGEITLITAKSKVAPIKTKTTLARLELCAAHLLAKLLNRVKKALQLKNPRIYAWSDSTITLSWIKGDTSKWKTFVANRVSEINQYIAKDAWHHVVSAQNPADYISRGVEAIKLKKLVQWWNGPEWLKQTHYPINEIQIKPVVEETKREKQLCLHVNIKNSNIDIIKTFSTKTKLVRVITQCMRFAQNCRNLKNKRTGSLTVKELQLALNKITIIDQNHEYQSEITALSNGDSLDNKSKLKILHPFIDGEGILRVGGRLQHSLLTYDEKHPIILSAKSHLSKLIIQEAHKITLHGGNQQTLAYVRRKYWIINGKREVKNNINKCIVCVRYKAQTAQQLMGQLPTPRVRPAAPFENTGVDYAGPIQIRVSKGRGNKSYKGYIAIFVCLATKGIHLEIVSDMTTEAFLAAMQRFMSRRGRCTNIYSDNGSNFIGASKIIEEEVGNIIKNSTISDELATKGTQWHFIPPSSPHFGGLWEAGVKSTKYHLKRIIGDATLTYEELSTLTHQIEACLNSRPLCPLSEDIQDTSVITPSHFLIGQALLTPADKVQENIEKKLTGRWKLVQKMKKQFWKAWSSEYIHNLQQRYKWQTKKENLKIGDVILIKEQVLNAAQWPIARIIEVHPDEDGAVRVVTVKRSDNQVFKRPIHKLILLPINGNDEEAQSNKKVATVASCNLIRVQAKKKPTSTTRSAEAKHLSWKMMIMIFLYILSIGKANIITNYVIENPQPGMYIEQIGHARIEKGMFRIEIKFPKNKIENDTQSVNETINKIKAMCLQMQDLASTIECQSLMYHLEEKERIINWLKKGIEKSKVKRQKRGVLGDFLTSIFGVNDEVYKDIEVLDKNQKEIIQTTKHQTKLMLQILSKFNDTEQRINSKLNHFKERLNKGLDVIRDMQRWYNKINENKLAIHLLSVYQVASNYIDDLEELYRKLLNIHFNKGDLYEFISPAHIEDLINKASRKLPAGIQILEYPIQKTGLEHSNEFIHVFGYFYILETTEFLLIKATAIPHKIENHQYWMMDLSSDIIGIDYNSQQYFTSTADEFIKNTKIEDYVYICTPAQLKSIDNSPSCIVDEIYQRNEKSTCSISQRKFKKVIWQQLYTKNAWLFIAPEKFRIAITCNGIREDVSLNKTGIITISQNCLIITKTTILTPRRTDSIPILAGFTRPVVANLTTSRIINGPEVDLDQDEVIKPNDNLVKLKYDEEELQQKLDETKWKTIRHHSVLVNTSTVASVGVLVLILLYVGKKVLQRRKKRITIRNRNGKGAEEAATEFELKQLEIRDDMSQK